MSEPRLDFAALFDKARDSDLAAIAGVTLWRVGQRFRGECPVCGASKGKRAGGAFWIHPTLGRWGCFAGGGECAAGGDAVRLEQLLRGGSPREAAERLAGAAPLLPGASSSAPPPDPRRAAPPADPTHSVMADRLWAESRRAGGTFAELYFRHRGLVGWAATWALSSLRFHPNAYWGFDEDQGRHVRAPAIIARPATPSGFTGGVHVTYLAPGGRGKAQLDPAKRMWGPQGDAQGRPGGAWLIGPQGDGPLIVAEGIESAVSAALIYGRRCRLVATLSLRALQGGWLGDKFGRYDPDLVLGDPARPAFTWPEDPAQPWGEVLVAVDRDMKPVEVKSRGPGGRSVRRRVTTDERARICAALSQQAWRRAGAPSVRAIAPAAGRDFNDQLRGMR
jgi:hypothetical protein